MEECLENLVGLTDIDCECFSDLQPEGWDTSESGRYLTDPEVGFPTLEAVFQSVDCGNEFWAMMNKARTDAIREFRHELGIMMKKYNNPRVPPFRGTIGEVKYRSRFTTNNTYLGILFKFPRWRDAELKITRIGLNISVAATVEVHFISNDPDNFPAKTVEIETVANQTTFVDIPEEDSPYILPFHSENRDDLIYAIYYTLPEGARANENKITCGCKGDDPIRRGTFLAGGFTSDTLDELEDITPGHSANGLSVGCYLDCDYTNFLCNLAELSGQDLLDDAAAAIQAKGAAKLISMVLDTGRINRYTLKPIEELYGRRTRLQNNFVEYVTAISKNYRPELSGCWKCKSSDTWQRRAIKA